ncbi:ABC-type proline/glycine betaine transport system, periplasmic component [Rhizobium leguminosarum bv. trifolii WSM597]|uniref:ABC-type proline/glycine betaine transport system, periplasmic component n=1 Tax=Rhizobium leguminosarum bv. trifolii WSM597 TaxID=754764 RepID=I9X5Q5_RHILT|nr:ABC transporter substrate-binding protein [Rhizobium leguminosarum]EJB04136.1 ABC-type proline/glycine betaine transport system, periplasmic component [Rhizobium leguminosarum bv. trifolii WSM597]
MNRTLRFCLSSAAALLVGTTVHAAPLGAKDETIKLAVNEWTGQQITTHIAGKMLEAAGYKVEYVTAGYQNMWQAVSEGQLDAALEVWSSNVTEQYKQLNKDGKVEDLGPLGLDAREGFVYPPHVADLCPGLPDWEALKKCAAAFATAETLPKGRLIDYPGDWGTPGADRIKALGLPFKAIPAGSEGALVAEFKASAERKTPLIAVFWQPHWAIAAYNLKFVALPKGTPECYSDPAYGPNKDVTGDCDFLPTRVFKAAWPGLKSKWPAAYEILKGLTLNVEQQQPLMGAVDVDGKSAEAVTSQWIEANAAIWKPTVDAATK